LNGYVWGSSASGSGTTQTVTFPSVGSYTVTVYSPAGGNYSVSNTATAMITVNLATPPTVYVAPASSTIYAGQSITFTASGGTNGYVWGGSASGSGTSQTVTFPSTGSYSVTVYSPAGGIYAVSNTATATITVSPPLVTASISANPTSGVAPASSTITWTSSNATSVSVSGTGLSSSNASGSQSVGPFSAGMYTYTITATGPGGSAAPTATFVVSAGFLTVSPSGTVQFPDAVRDTLALGPSNISGGAISSTKVFTLQNTGNAPLNITGIGLSGASSSCFTVQTQLTLPYALAPGASVQVTLVFTPGALGSAAPIGAVPNTTFSVTSDVNTPPPVTIFGICRAPKISITWHQ
jgi:plastocyanin